MSIEAKAMADANAGYPILQTKSCDRAGARMLNVVLRLLFMNLTRWKQGRNAGCVDG